MWYWVMLMAIDVPLWVMAGRIVFGSWGAFGAAMRAAFPTTRGEFWEFDDDEFVEVDPEDAPMLGPVPGLVYVGGCIGLVAFEYYVLRHFGIGP